MRRQQIKNTEWWILACALILSAIGLLALYSVSYNTEFSELKRQAVWLGISVVLMVIIIFIDYEVIAKISAIWYVLFGLLLVAVLFTKPIDGASRWFDMGAFTLQPAEFAKIFVVLFMAYVISKIQEKRYTENK